MKSKIVKRILLFVLSLVVFYGCNNTIDTDDDSNTIHGSGNIVTQSRTVDECSGITVKSFGNVYLTQDDNQSILIEADDNIIDEVIIRKENGVLFVGLEDGSYSNVTVKLYVSLKTIESLTINGAGNITTQNSLTCDNLSLNINGAGNITVTGSGNYLNSLINGAGNILAKDFIVEKCKADVNGAGNCTVYVTEELDAVINGAGNIYYYGNPSVVRTSISGVGRIIKK